MESLSSFFLVNCLTIIFYYYYRDIHLSFGQIISQIIGIELNDKVLWYMQALLILYVIFIVSKQWNFYPPILLGVMIFAYLLVQQYISPKSDFRYVSIYGFYLGYLLSHYRNSATKWIMVCLSILTLMYLVSLIAANKPIIILIVLIFILITIILIFYLKINKNIYLGIISYEVYLVHMKVFGFLSNFHSRTFVNLWYFIALTLLVAMILHTILHPSVIVKASKKISVIIKKIKK